MLKPGTRKLTNKLAERDELWDIMKALMSIKFSEYYCCLAHARSSHLEGLIEIPVLDQAENRGMVTRERNL